MKKPKKQYRQLYVAAAILYFLALFAYGFWNYTYQKSELLSNVDAKLYNCAIALKHMLPDDYHDRAIDEDAISIEEDREIVNKFNEYVKETDVKYIYTIIKKNEKLFFVASEVTVDPKEIGIETPRGTYYFYEYTDADESFYAAFDSARPTYNTVSDQWGEVRTVMIPQTSPGGIKYLACADYDIGYIRGLLRSNLLQSIAIAAFFLLLGVPIILIYTRLRSEYYGSLRESEEQYRTLVANVPGVTYRCRCDEHWTMEFISDEIEKLSGYPASDFIENAVRSYSSIMHSEGKQISDKHAMDQIAKKEPYTIEYRIVAADGSFHWVYEKGQGIYDANDELKYLDGVIMDVTDRKQAEELQLANEQQLRASNQQLMANEKEREELVKTLEYKNKELRDIVYTTSHDLRSPLVNIEGFSGELHSDCDKLLEMLTDNSDGQGKGKQIEALLKENIPESLRFIAGSAKKMAGLLDGLLQISRVGSVEIKSEPIDMNKTMGEVLASMEHQIKESNIAVTVESLADCIGDSDMLNNAFSNLIGNAIKYRDPAMEGAIKISSEVKDDLIVYCVEDNGIGIDIAYQSKVFEIFHRLNPDDAVEGEGLGLTIVTRIVDRLGGRIWLESEAGVGSSFFVALPMG